MYYERFEGEAIRLLNENTVETVVMLSHKKPDSVINVKVEFGEGEGKVPLDNIAKRAETYKPKERVTYKMIKEYIEAKYGFKVHTAYIAEVKRDLGLPDFVTREDFDWVVRKATAKKKQDFSKTEFFPMRKVCVYSV